MNKSKLSSAGKNTNTAMELSIIVPAYREEAGIQEAIKCIRGAVLKADVSSFEIIVVDDGSPDNTFSKIEKLVAECEQVRGIRLSRNFGKEAALLAGLEAARGQAVVTIDADLQHPPELIPEMLKAWRQGVQIVHAVKRARVSDTRLTRLRANTFNGLFSRLCGFDLNNSSDFKLLDRLIVDLLINDIAECERFYRGLVGWVGFRQQSIEFDVAPRNAGKSNWSLMGLLELAMSATVSFSSAPLRIVTGLGVATLLLAFVIIVETLWSLFHGRAVSGFATIIITLLVVGSFIMISLGIVGEYIARIFHEVKRRPAYFVAESCLYDKAIPEKHEFSPPEARELIRQNDVSELCMTREFN